MKPRRRSIVLIAAFAITTLALALAHPVRQMRLGHIVTTADAPDPADMHAFVRAGQQSAARLGVLWNTGRIVPRLFVAAELREAPDADPGYLRLLLQAVRTRDPDLMQPAFYGLLKHHRPVARTEALSLLTDSDPEVVLLALRTLGSAGTPSDFAHLLPLLQTADLPIAIAAHNTLSRLTGESRIEFNLRLPAERNEALRHWQAVVEASSLLAAPLPPPSPIEPLVAPDLTLTTLDGKDIRLSDLRGRRIVLNFWATWCAPCIAEMPTLEALSRSATDPAATDPILAGVVVLGVCIDPAGPPTPGAPLDQRVRELLAEQRVTYANAIDHSGDATSAAAAQGVPLTLLIGTDGKVYRRFTGPRTLDSLIRMVGELP